jgi:hypothetical protein
MKLRENVVTKRARGMQLDRNWVMNLVRRDGGDDQ